MSRFSRNAAESAKILKCLSQRTVPLQELQLKSRIFLKKLFRSLFFNRCQCWYRCWVLSTLYWNHEQALSSCASSWSVDNGQSDQPAAIRSLFARRHPTTASSVESYNLFVTTSFSIGGTFALALCIAGHWGRTEKNNSRQQQLQSDCGFVAAKSRRGVAIDALDTRSKTVVF